MDQADSEALRPKFLPQYKFACVTIVQLTFEEHMDDAVRLAARSYWTGIRDGLMLKYKFTEEELNG